MGLWVCFFVGWVGVRGGWGCGGDEITATRCDGQVDVGISMGCVNRFRWVYAVRMGFACLIVVFIPCWDI
jgi:hypothetical protein